MAQKRHTWAEQGGQKSPREDQARWRHIGDKRESADDQVAMEEEEEDVEEVGHEAEVV